MINQLLLGGGSGLVPMNAVTQTSLLLFDGPNSDTSMFYDSGAYNYFYLTPSLSVVSSDEATLSTTQSKFGGSSALGGGPTKSKQVCLASSNSLYYNTQYLTLGTADAGVQFWARPTSSAAGFCVFVDCRSGGTNVCPVIYQDATNLYLYFSAAVKITAAAIPLNTWSFVEWSRVSGVSRLFVDGVLVGSVADTADYAAFRVNFCCDVSGATADPVYIDCARVFLAGGNTTSYVAPTTVFTSGAAATSTWNPSDKNSTVTLAAENRVAYTQTNFGAVRGQTGRSSGVYQFEIYTRKMPGTAVQNLVGLGTSGASLTDYPGADANSYGYYSANGNKYNNNSGSAYGTSWTDTNIIGCVYDATAGEIRFYRDGVSQGAAFTSISGTLYPMWGAGNNTAENRSGMINTGQFPFMYPIGGATAWG